MKTISLLLETALVGSVAAATFAQGRLPPPTPIASSDLMSQISMFSYEEGPKSDLVLRGTPIASNAQGKAQVEYENSNAQISVKVADLPPPGALGPYTGYVLWALTPDGRASNQGLLAGAFEDKGALETMHGASQFALIVTAEPHFAVTAPSTAVVLYNVAGDVKGRESKVTSLIEQADYSKIQPLPVDEKVNPPELVQARYAVAIAEAAGASRYAPDAIDDAKTKLNSAESALSGKRKEREGADALAREAVVAGEDARRASLRGAAVEAERQAAAEAQQRTSEAAAGRASRQQLISRLEAALPTRETDRGLVSEIGGVEFARGTANLSAGAREGLARFAGIVASYPGLRFNVEGHTDNTGSLATNNELSLQRAIAVRDYLIGQGVPASVIDVDGLGPSQPVADNRTEAGRARNRRVEIVIAGELLAAR